MKNLKHLLSQPLQQIHSSAIVFILIIALIGFIDASYLTIEHYRGVIPPCSITAGCEDVLTSGYSIILGIPVSIVGSLFYLFILIGAFAYLESKNTLILKWALVSTILGFLFSLWFTFIQVFILHSYCIYCLGSAFSSTILFVTAMHIFSRYQEQNI